MRAAGKPTDQPNLVMGINVQVCWEKFCRYWDVEARFVPIEGTRYHLTAEEAVKYCDENTIGVVAIMGSTYDGSYEPVKEINDALDALQREKGWDIPMHVDGAVICQCLPSHSRKKRISRCLICLNGCEAVDGYYQPIPSPRISSTWRYCGWSSKRGSVMTWRICYWMICVATWSSLPPSPATRQRTRGEEIAMAYHHV